MVLAGATGRKKLHCLSGDVRGKTVIVVDDMIDTGGTLKHTAEVLKREGATDFYILSTHGLFSHGAIDAIRSIDRAYLKGIVVSNSIPQEANKEALNDGKPDGNNLLNVLDISSEDYFYFF